MALKTEVKNQIIPEHQLLKESSPLGKNSGFYDYLYNPTTRPTLAVGDMIYDRQLNTSPVKTTYKAKLALSASDACLVTGFFTEGFHSNIGNVQGYDGASSSFTQLIRAGGETIYIDLPPYLYHNAQINVTFKMITAGTAPICSIKFINGVALTSDFDYHFPINSLTIGDSTTWYGMGFDPTSNPILGDMNWDIQLKRLLLADGLRTRVINKGFGGSRTGDMDRARRLGVYDLSNIGIIYVSYGMNDCDGAVTTISDFKARLLSMITWRNQTYKGVPIVFLAPSVTDTSGRVSNISAYRTAIYEVATDATIGGTSRNVWYYDQSTAFALNATATADTNFALQERVAGQRLHPNENGRALIAAGLFNLVKTIPSFYTKWRNK